MNAPKAIEDMTAIELREELKLATAEAYDLRHRLNSELMRQAQRDRAVAAVIRRSEWEQVDLRGEMYALHRVGKMATSVEGILYRIEQLGERASAKQVDGLKTSARDARHVLALAKDRRPDTELLDAANAEIRRLRDVIVERGRALHRQLAPEATACDCAGCDLIRAMDLNAPSVEKALNETEPAA